MMKMVSHLARKMVMQPIRTAANVTPMPQAVASVLKDATLNALDMAVEYVVDHDEEVQRNLKSRNGASLNHQQQQDVQYEVTMLIENAFAPLEETLNEMEKQLEQARKSLKLAKQQSIVAMEAIEAAAIAQVEGTVEALRQTEESVSRQALANMYVAAQQEDKSMITITLDEVDFGTSEMAPPFLDENSCLVPGEPVVRVERAPENSRRIFAGVDIPHSVDEVWNLLTDYHHLQDVVPNLIVNDVLEEFHVDFDKTRVISPDASLPEEEQCQQLANQMKGAKLRQVGGAKVAGIQFSARTTLEVREWPEGLPDFAHFNDEMWQGKSRKERASEYTKIPLKRYRFPRPFAISSLPTRDISMQSIEDDDGEFRMYQGVWRMQPLLGCGLNGKDATRLTYAVEVSPRAFLPVSLIEGRIVRDLTNNLSAIRDYLAQINNSKNASSSASETVPAR
jgi:hypothetical protein